MPGKSQRSSCSGGAAGLPAAARRFVDTASTERAPHPRDGRRVPRFVEDVKFVGSHGLRARSGGAPYDLVLRRRPGAEGLESSAVRRDAGGSLAAFVGSERVHRFATKGGTVRRIRVVPKKRRKGWVARRRRPP